MIGAIDKAAVIGAGVMGAGIAAHLANAGLRVVLLDMADDGANRNHRAEEAVQRQLAIGGFMHPSLAGRITAGNVEDHFGLVADADWIIEAVAERIEVKRDLFARLETVRKDGSIVSSNTSTLPLTAMTEHQTPRFARDFLVAHFFNPPRHMRLLELVAGAATRPDAVERIREFADIGLGKGVVSCNDRPGFIGNRIGCFWIAAGLSEALALGLTVEEADAVLGRPFGIPATGVFGLLDLVGLDLMPQIWGSLGRHLPSDDPVRRFDLDPPLIRSMVERGRAGRKSGGGFYRVSGRGAERVREALDLTSGEYRPLRPAALESLADCGKDIAALMSHPDPGGQFAWRVMAPTLAYAAALIPEIADDPHAVDEAMRLGYGWADGPFQLIDRLGAAWFAERLAASGEPVPPLLGQAAAQGGFYRSTAGRRASLRPGGGYRPLRPTPGVLTLAEVRASAIPVAANRAGSVWDLGDGVACLEFHTKANAFDSDLLAMVEQAVVEVGQGFRTLVLGNDAAGFSAGADLRGMLDAARRQDWAWVEALIRTGQRAFRGLKFAPFPVVAAVSGATLGGGCEAALHCDAIQAHAELTMGLVETKVGLIPGWGGTKELLLRLTEAGGPAPSLGAFRLIRDARTSSSAREARELGFLRPSDGITMNRDRLLADAKATALRLAPGYVPPRPASLPVAGPETRDAVDAERTVAGRADTPHDRLIRDLLATMLTAAGHDQAASEDALYDLEREAFLTLIRCEEAQARIRRMVEGGARSGG